ncbi:bacteriohemerythrin [Magnetospirillum sp. ME-1]|uniref:bacteriohemerythrin n=1 Tax=Magnetospirillum sp. ME-1 TaxID=1639348 RepID=UPI000A18B999|nr:hemerythrin domain-containing protein [Magnetospirillum sp. ME-1]
MKYEYFVWTDSLLIGNETIDNDHKVFFDIANLIVDLANSGEADARSFRDSVKLLKNYARAHFDREELFMRRIGYAQWIDNHIERHEQFLAIINEQALSICVDDRKAIYFLANTINDWINSHIKEEDQKLKKYIDEMGIDGGTIANYMKFD